MSRSIWDDGQVFDVRGNPVGEPVVRDMDGAFWCVECRSYHYGLCLNDPEWEFN